MRAAGLLNDRFYPLETNVAAAEICHKGGKSHSLRYALSSAERTKQTFDFFGFAYAAFPRTCGKIFSTMQRISPNRPFERVSDLLCMSNMAHASKLKEHDNNDDFQGSFRRAA